ncbi:MAG: SRPBCC domain-containing protein [Acidaminobacteraceae bacterium]
MDNNMSANIERILETSPNIVWKMWTDADSFKTWYGPNGFSIEVLKMDVVEGGEHLICMTMPDGERKMYTTGVYKEVAINKKLVYTDIPCDESGKRLEPEAMGMPKGSPMTTEVIIELLAMGDNTKMIMKHVGVPETTENMWNQAFDKMVLAIEKVM